MCGEQWYVYFIINEVNLKLYIGKTNDPKGRWRKHRSEAKRPNTVALYRSVKKHGSDKFHFTIWSAHNSEAEAFSAEVLCIELFDSLVSGHGYNMTRGGEGARLVGEARENWLKSISTPEHKEKQSQAQNLRWQSQEARDKMSQEKKDYFLIPGNLDKNRQIQKIVQNTPEAKLRASQAATKRFSSPEARIKASKANIEYFESPEAREKARLSTLNYFKTPGAKERASASQKAANATPEARERQRRIMLDYYDTPELRQRKLEATELYLSGKTVPEISIQVGRSRPVIIKYLQDTGVYKPRNLKRNRNAN